MSKILFIILLLIISCNQEWTDAESSDFLNRCKQKKPSDLAIDSNFYNSFCLCLEKESQKTNISYQNFLTIDLAQSDLNKIVNSCIDE